MNVKKSKTQRPVNTVGWKVRATVFLSIYCIQTAKMTRAIESKKLKLIAPFSHSFRYIRIQGHEVSCLDNSRRDCNSGMASASRIDEYRLREVVYTARTDYSLAPRSWIVGVGKAILAEGWRMTSSRAGIEKTISFFTLKMVLKLHGEQVGSFPRPGYLVDTRNNAKEGNISEEDLLDAEHKAISCVV